MTRKERGAVRATADDRASSRRWVEPVASREDLREFDARLRRLAAFFLLVFLVLGARLYQLQITMGAAYDQMASRNFVRTVEVPPDRGAIFDARGRTLAENRPSYDVLVSPRVLARHPDAVEEIAVLLSLSDSARVRLVEAIAAGGQSDYLVARDVTRDVVAVVESRRQEIPGTYVSVSQRRYYPYDTLAAHLVGYVNEIRADEVRDAADDAYRPGDRIGRTGIERAYERVLRGAPGLIRQVVNVNGEVESEDVNRALLGDYRVIDSVAGRDVHLTIDTGLQGIIESAMADAISGAVVVVDPRDGAVLGTYSKPGFDPNAWSGRLSEHEKRASDNDPFHPMLDKSVLSYFPASTYKIITALAALEEGIVDPSDEIDCNGHLDYGNRRFHCWNRGGHGHMNLREALAHSCDVYFYEVALQLGIDTLARYAVELGLGERPGLAMNGEHAGVVPTREWHAEHSPGGFQYGFTVNTSVGQGDTRASPLQMALAYAALANGGRVFYPRVVSAITSADGDPIFRYPPRLRRTLPFSPSSLDHVVDGLDDVLNLPDGTGYGQRLPYVQVVGKTGTAQVRSLETVRLLNGEIVHWDRDHAWFIAVAPRHDPVVAVAVFLEHGGQGSRAAAPVAMRIIDQYLRDALGWRELIDGDTANGYSAALSRSLAPRRPSVPAVAASFPAEYLGLGEPDDAEVAAR